MSTFINPYNFIPLSGEKQEKYEEIGTHTGVIEYSITTKSPFFVPNTSSDNAFQCGKDHKSFDFFSYTPLNPEKDYSRECHEPIIPGSELRGMVRNIYETLTGSCMAGLSEDVIPVRRSTEVFRAGLLHYDKIKNEIILVEAEDCIYRKKTGRYDYEKLYLTEKLKEGTKVWFNKTDRKANGRPIKQLVTYCSENEDDTLLSNGKKWGFLVKGMPDGVIGKKHNCHIFIPIQSKKHQISKEDINNLIRVLDSYREKQKDSNRLQELLDSSQYRNYEEELKKLFPDKTERAKAYKEYRTELDNFLSGKGEEYFPVYYSVIKSGKNKQEQGNEGEKKIYYYLSPASYTKEVSHHSIGELAGSWKPCKTTNCCPACALFGMIGYSDGTAQAVTSGIRFSDAYIEDRKNRSEDYYDRIITLENLAEPKLSNTEFYLEKPDVNPEFWNYDYYIKDGKVELYSAKLRGRKFYWHQPDKKLPEGVEKTKQNSTIRPVRSGITFKGKLFFDRISDKQLKQLLWILNGGTEKEQPQNGPIAYKLGKGKPLGLGSVELKVVNVSERKIGIENYEIQYHIDKQDEPDIGSYEESGFVSDKDVKKAFFTIHALHAVDNALVSYPLTPEQQGKNMEEGFKWFVKNREDGNMLNSRTRMEIKQSLPKLDGIGFLTCDPLQIPPEPKRVSEASFEAGVIYEGIVKKLKEGKKKADIYCAALDKTFNFKSEHVVFATGKKLDDVLKEGDKVKVQYIGVDENGKQCWKCIENVSRKLSAKN